MVRHLLILLILYCLPLFTAAAQDAAHITPAYGLIRLAANIDDGQALQRHDLAYIALSELASVYADEAERARSDMRRRAQQRKLSTWVVAVEALATEYATLADSMTHDTPVQIDTGTGDNLHLIVAGRLVVVNSPRMREQAAFEQRIIAHFCALHRCEDLVDDPGFAIAAAPAVSSTASPEWRFSQSSGPVCSTRDGLEFQFLNAKNLGRKRVTCALVVDELNTLAAAIAQEMAGGIRVDWNRLAIHPQPDGDEQVILNGEGDFMRLPLPTLVERQNLFAIVRPWLAAKVKGTPYSLVVIQAGHRLALPGRSLD